MARRTRNNGTPRQDALPPAHRLRLVRQDLLEWYRRHRRRLPWRRDDPNPYHVLVSEAMLQQTQVATVVAYFERFILAFPTVQALAEADEQAVLTLWQGLGYYRRARHLHAAARVIVEKHGGQVPGDHAALLALPGVGRYTAGAVASIAFGLPEPILDGNAARVWARIEAMDQPTNQPGAQRRLWQLAEAYVPSNAAGEFNQAVMELGAMVCTPRAPGCLTCPVRAHCRANQVGLAEKLPVVPARKKAKAVEHHVLALHRRTKWLFEQRPASGLWPNMWQLPTLEEPKQTDEPATLQAWIRERLGLEVTLPVARERFAHATTHRAITFVVWVASVNGGRLRPRRGQWRSLEALDDLPLPNPQRAVVRSLLQQ